MLFVGEDELLTVSEAADRAGLSKTGIHSAITRGKLPVVEKYGRLLLRPADVDAYKATVRKGRPRKGAEGEGETKQ